MIIYGRNAVREALRGKRAVEKIWATKGLLGESWLEGCQASLSSDEDLTLRSGSDAHQGICAKVEPYTYSKALDLLESKDERRLLIALDRIQDPQNLGSVCRVAESVGAGGVILPERRSAEVTAAVCKASAGAVEHLSIVRVRNLSDFLNDAKQVGYWCYGAAGEADASLFECEFAAKAVIVMGSEGKGLGRRVSGTCDQLLALPMRGKVDSLNVATATAVFAYEFVRQNPVT